MSKFVVAMVLFAALELVSWQTLSDEKIRFVVMAVIAMFALRAYVHHRRESMKNTQTK